MSLKEESSIELKEPLLDTLNTEEKVTGEDDVIENTVSRKSMKISKGLRVCSRVVIFSLEKLMYRLGLLVGDYPFATIGTVILITTVFGVGLLNFKINSDFRSQWVPQESLINLEWTDKYLPLNHHRISNLILTSENILSPNVLMAMLDLHLKIVNSNLSDGVTWNKHCLQPLGLRCFSSSILELWSFEETIISNLTKVDILERINKDILIRPIYYTKVNIESILGGLTRDENGYIIGARAAQMTYVLEKSTVDAGESVQLERNFVDKGLSSNYKDIEDIYIYTPSSYQRESMAGINKDLPKAVAAAIPILIYLICMLGKLNQLENKVVLSLMGLFCICLSIITAFGLCSACNFSYGPLHSMLFLLLIGIGVDDMFVIVQGWKNINEKNHESSIKENIGLTLKKAGVSITVTSLTDVVAFLVGSSFNLPAVRSFSLYAGVAILFLFFYTVTFFAACLVLDARRVRANRDAIICCYKLSSDYTPNNCSQRNYLQSFLSRIYAPFLLRTPSKILVICLTFSIFGAGLIGASNLEDESDLTRFLSSDSYLYKFIQATKEYFPNDLRIKVYIYMRDIDYYSEYKSVNQLYSDLIKNEYVKNSTLTSWFEHFHNWMLLKKERIELIDSDGMPMSEELFYTWLKEFLYHSIDGLFVYEDINFDPVENIIYASRLKFTFVDLPSTSQKFEAMMNIKSVATNANFKLSNASFALSPIFLQWDAIKAVSDNLIKNCGILITTVFLVILILLANLWCSFLIMLSLILTVVDIVGFMNFWGLSVDTVTSTVVLLAIGYSVDHSAHIGVAFMKESGSKRERGIKALGSVAPAVFNAGFSTILATLPVAFSTSYIFITAFKVMFLMTIFGLFHGIVFMPVILSYFGPNSYSDSVIEEQKPAPEEINSVNSQYLFPTYTATVQNSKKEVFKFPT